MAFDIQYKNQYNEIKNPHKFTCKVIFKDNVDRSVEFEGSLENFDDYESILDRYAIYNINILLKVEYFNVKFTTISSGCKILSFNVRLEGVETEDELIILKVDFKF